MKATIPGTGQNVLTVDIAHPPMSGTEAEERLGEAFNAVRLSGSLRILKIIHGYGSGGRGGSLKTVTENWCHRHCTGVRAIVKGGESSPFHPRIQEMAAECGIASSSLITGGDGITLIWVK